MLTVLYMNILLNQSFLLSVFLSFFSAFSFFLKPLLERFYSLFSLSPSICFSITSSSSSLTLFPSPLFDSSFLLFNTLSLVLPHFFPFFFFRIPLPYSPSLSLFASSAVPLPRPPSLLPHFLFFNSLSFSLHHPFPVSIFQLLLLLLPSLLFPPFTTPPLSLPPPPPDKHQSMSRPPCLSPGGRHSRRERSVVTGTERPS